MSLNRRPPEWFAISASVSVPDRRAGSDDVWRMSPRAARPLRSTACTSESEEAKLFSISPISCRSWASPNRLSDWTSHTRPAATDSESRAAWLPVCPVSMTESNPLESRMTCLRPCTASRALASCAMPSTKASTRWRYWACCEAS